MSLNLSPLSSVVLWTYIRKYELCNNVHTILHTHNHLETFCFSLISSVLSYFSFFSCNWKTKPYTRHGKGTVLSETELYNHNNVNAVISFLNLHDQRNKQHLNWVLMKLHYWCEDEVNEYISSPRSFGRGFYR